MRNGILSLAILMVGSFASPAMAGYVGASFVQTDSEFQTAVDNFDADDSSYKFYLGGRISRLFDLEISYRDLGTHQQTIGLNTVDVEITAYDLALRGLLPVAKRISLFGKAGYARVEFDGSLDVGGLVESFDSDDWDPIYGVGFDIKLTDSIGLRAEWEIYDVDDDLNSLSAGAFLHF